MIRSDLTEEGQKHLEELLKPILREDLDLEDFADKLRHELFDSEEHNGAIFTLKAEDSLDGEEHLLVMREKDHFYWTDPGEGYEPRGLDN